MLNIYLTISNKYLLDTLYCITSILLLHDNVHFYIATIELDKLTDNNKNIISKLIENFNNKSTVEFFDFSEQYKNELYNANHQCNPYMGVRLLLDTFVNKGLDTLLYIDCDTIILTNLLEYRNKIKYSNMDYLALLLPFESYYSVNGGVIYFNLNNMKQNNTISKLKEIYKNDTIHINPDEYALSNATDKIMSADDYFNNISKHHMNKGIIHYALKHKLSEFNIDEIYTSVEFLKPIVLRLINFLKTIH